MEILSLDINSSESLSLRFGPHSPHSSRLQYEFLQPRYDIKKTTSTANHMKEVPMIILMVFLFNLNIVTEDCGVSIRCFYQITIIKLCCSRHMWFDIIAFYIELTTNNFQSFSRSQVFVTTPRVHVFKELLDLVSPQNLLPCD